ncbi:SGNH/GDSL hydrolase family protein [Pedobacter mucosus]|uniref:SGNH/GDSL hydrolase family protein n=1 Tax=Pedobacter mucosus TaxID=2895286 RepID=UPI001EE4DC2F|nr:GDSL-type esterase/lipase family protein [Pedobacter mucosus]UKT65949.1 GDSL-type esterase/lipase family protein [Pedobacter mucosus]
MKLTRRKLITGSTAFLGLTLINKSTLSYANENLFANQDQTELKVINAGVGGNNTIDLLARIDKDCLSYMPKLTVLMAGTNDMNSVKYVPLAEYEKNLVSIVKQIKATGSKILIMTILPTYEPHLLTRHPASFYDPEGVQGRRKQVNDVIKNVADRHKIHCLDLGHRFEAIGKIGLDKDSLIRNEANSNITDGIHPTANGYRFIALTVYDYIMLTELPQNNIVCFGDSITKGDGTITKDSYPAFLKKLLA